ncbi:serine hydrolase domain-containing protein [Fictibacillus iocasae]|uniref:Serine hydrolase domain-containing protein n=1 Tax=Fictibacillus iocasae TaxID=2715437 RepID=A0ABW2NM67_9BACL
MDINLLKQKINKTFQSAGVPGAAVAVVGKNGVIYETGYGLLGTWEGAGQTTSRSPFYLGSLTKPVTGALILRLMEEGVLDLDTPIRTYIPWFQLQDEEAAKMVTLRMLLSHTSGLPHVFDAFGSTKKDQLEKLVRGLPQYALSFFPGQTWCYSDLGIDTAGFVAEAVTGKYYADLVQEYVFEPLGMKGSTFDPSRRNELMNVAGLPGNGAHLPSSFAISSASDMAKFAQMLLNEDDPFLSRTSREQMSRVHGDYYLPDNSGYGIAIELDHYQGEKRLWHDGAIQNYGAWMYAVPKRDIAVIMLTNGRHELWNTALETIEVILSEYMSEKANVRPISYDGPVMDLSLCEGTYTGAWKGYASVKNDGGVLHLTLDGEETILSPFGRDRFTGTIADMTISAGFQENKDGQVVFMMLDGVPCEKVSPFPDFEYTPPHLLDFIGIYKKNNDLLQFHVKDNILHCYDQYDDASHKCKIMDYDTVVAGNVLITFERKECGEPTAILVNKSVLMPRS